MKRVPIRPLVVLVLFAVLVLVLLWFQGILGRHLPASAPVPGLPAAGPAERIVPVVARVLPEVQSQPGHVQAELPVELGARVMAQVLTVAVREGDPVAAGDVLVTLDDRDARAGVARAEAGLAAAKAEALRARLQLQRVERLGAASAATTQEREAAVAAQAGAAAQVQAAEQGVDEARAMASHFTLRAPAAGVVLQRHADPGDLAVPGRPLLSLYQPDALRFAAAVPEALAGALRPRQELSVEFAGAARVAQVVRILPGADPATGTVLVHFAPVDRSGLRPGQLGRLLLPVGERQALLLPATAVRRTGQVEWVELVRDGHLVPVTVRSGKRHGAELEILSGILAGEQVQLP